MSARDPPDGVPTAWPLGGRAASPALGLMRLGHRSVIGNGRQECLPALWTTAPRSPRPSGERGSPGTARPTVANAAHWLASARRPRDFHPAGRPRGVGRGVPAEPRRPNDLLSPPRPAHQTARVLPAKSQSLARQPLPFRTRESGATAGRRGQCGVDILVCSRHPPDGVPTAWPFGGSGGFPPRSG